MQWKLLSEFIIEIITTNYHNNKSLIIWWYHGLSSYIYCPTYLSQLIQWVDMIIFSQNLPGMVFTCILWTYPIFLTPMSMSTMSQAHLGAYRLFSQLFSLSLLHKKERMQKCETIENTRKTRLDNLDLSNEQMLIVIFLPWLFLV